MVKFCNVKKHCLECSKQLKLNNTRDIERKKFCSKSCSSIYYLKNHIAGMYGKKMPISARKKMSAQKIGKYNGQNNPRYIDGRTIFRKVLSKYKEKKCCACGVTSGYFIAHHKEPCIRTNDRARYPIFGDHSILNLDVCKLSYQISQKP